MKRTQWVAVLVLLIQVGLRAQIVSRIGGEVDLRGNGSVVYSGENDRDGDMSDLSTGFGFGLFLTHELGPTTETKVGLMYAQRGYEIVHWVGRSLLLGWDLYEYENEYLNYIDIPIAIQQYFATDDGAPSIRPFVVAGIVPSFFLSGKWTYSGLDSTISRSLDSDDAAWFNFAVSGGLGLDFPFSTTAGSQLIVGYEYGLTNAFPSEITSDIYRRLVTVYISVNLTFALRGR